MIFALLLVNGLCYTFLVHVVYTLILTGMGYRLGAMPALVKRYLYAGGGGGGEQEEDGVPA